MKPKQRPHKCKAGHTTQQMPNLDIVVRCAWCGLEELRTILNLSPREELALAKDLLRLRNELRSKD